VHHQDIFGWNRAVSLEFEAPVTLRMLIGDQDLAGKQKGLLKFLPEE
jgi:hypothetical protein